MKIHSILLSTAILIFGLVIQPDVLAKQKQTMPHQRMTHPQMSSKSVLVIDIRNNKIIYANNPDRIVPIASLTKLMTAMVVLDARQPLTQMIPVKIDQTKELQGVYSRLKIGSQISRKDMLLLTLMSSENRAAASLAHNYPGGYNMFIRAMNAKAKALGMKNTRYVEPTGLSEHNVSTARDLGKQVIAARRYPLLLKLSATKEKTVTFSNPKHSLEFHNTNRLVGNSEWDIKLTKTGFTNKAGRCLTMDAIIGDREVAMITLGAYGKYTHFADAKRLRRWMESTETFSVVKGG